MSSYERQVLQGMEAPEARWSWTISTRLQWGVSSDIDTGLVASLDISLKVNCPYWDVVKNGVPGISLVTC